MNLNVCIAGATGWIGKPLCLAVSESGDLSLVGAVSRTHEGRSLKDVFADINLDVKISGSVAEALESPTDVLVDFTNADVVKDNVITAIRKGVHVVIGSSGLSDEDFVEIGQAALEHKVGVVAAGNFAITAVLLQRFACEAAKYLSHWEILDITSSTSLSESESTTLVMPEFLQEIENESQQDHS